MITPTGEFGTPELARPYFALQEQPGRRVVSSWRPADTSPHNPLTAP